MPIIQTYADNEVYIGFLKLPDAKRKELRQKFVDTIKKAIDSDNGK